MLYSQLSSLSRHDVPHMLQLRQVLVLMLLQLLLFLQVR